MNRLKELRQEKKLTQKELADIAEVSKRTYIYWENGESQIKPDKAQKLADYFKVSVGYLLGYSGNTKSLKEDVMKDVKVGLIKGRHVMPVDDFVIDNAIDDVLDFQAIKGMVWEKLTMLTKPFVAIGTGLNQDDYTDILVWRSDVHLHVYVTGLTSVTAYVIAFCACNGVKLTLHHYDAKTGDYVPQDIF